MQNPTKNKKKPERRKRLGEYLVEAGLIDEKAVNEALEVQKTNKKRLGQILIQLGFADEQVIAKTLASQLKIPFIRLDKAEIPQDVTSLVPADMAKKYLLIPIEKREKTLLVVMANPLELYAHEDLRFVTGLSIDVAIAPEKDILEAIQQYYKEQDLEKDLQTGQGFEEGIEFIPQEDDEEEDVEDLMDLTERPPVVRFINILFANAITQRASDIHIEPQKSNVIIRHRVDGIMREVMRTEKHVHPALVSRIKVISNMDISIQRRPQDGRSQVMFRGNSYDLRVSTIPTSYGEKVTIRILDQSEAGIGLRDLGFSEKSLKDIENIIKRPQGIMLVTGPTGSGKSSTLYACLNKLNAPTVNIITVEDPIEFDIQGINQVQINPKAGITFAAGLRSILRQDPDIVMVGEIRDSETASIAFQAAQTGHLVLSTLHTNDAPSAISRLLDLGVEPFLISASLIAVVGQRLVRRICKDCKIPDTSSSEILKQLPPNIAIGKNKIFWKGTGCSSCQSTGYSGRLCLDEILMITPSLKEIITYNGSAVALTEAAKKQGFQSMAIDGINKALEGLTTLEEVFRVVPLDVDESIGIPLVLPQAQDVSGPEAPLIAEMTAPISSEMPKKILLVDDSEVVLAILRKLLEAKDYCIVTAKNGIEALQLALQERPDLVITDYLMPKMDGITLIKKLRSEASSRSIPIIMLTAKDEVDSEVKGIDAGADDYLTKPINSKRLLARVNRLITRPQMAQM